MARWRRGAPGRPAGWGAPGRPAGWGAPGRLRGRAARIRRRSLAWRKGAFAVLAIGLALDPRWGGIYMAHRRGILAAGAGGFGAGLLLVAGGLIVRHTQA